VLARTSTDHMQTALGRTRHRRCRGRIPTSQLLIQEACPGAAYYGGGVPALGILLFLVLLGLLGRLLGRLFRSLFHIVCLGFGLGLVLLVLLVLLFFLSALALLLGLGGLSGLVVLVRVLASGFVSVVGVHIHEVAGGLLHSGNRLAHRIAILRRWLACLVKGEALLHLHVQNLAKLGRGCVGETVNAARNADLVREEARHATLVLGRGARNG